VQIGAKQETVFGGIVGLRAIGSNVRSLKHIKYRTSSNLALIPVPLAQLISKCGLAAPCTNCSDDHLGGLTLIFAVANAAIVRTRIRSLLA